MTKRPKQRLIILVLILIGVLTLLYLTLNNKPPEPTDYERCMGQGGVIVNSDLLQPGLLQCEINGQTFEEISTFDECAKAGNPIMDSHPEQCSAGGKTFTKPQPPPGFTD